MSRPDHRDLVVVISKLERVEYNFGGRRELILYLSALTDPLAFPVASKDDATELTQRYFKPYMDQNALLQWTFQKSTRIVIPPVRIVTGRMEASHSDKAWPPPPECNLL